MDTQGLILRTDGTGLILPLWYPGMLLVALTFFYAHVAVLHASLLAIIPGFPNLSMLRTLRVLRPLKVLSTNKGELLFEMIIYLF